MVAEDCRCITSCSALRYADAAFGSHFVDDTPQSLQSPTSGGLCNRFVLRFPEAPHAMRVTHSTLIRRRSACSALGSTLFGARLKLRGDSARCCYTV